MSEQMRLLPGLDPDALIAEAKERWSPIKTFCMFSGGNDSTVCAFRLRDHYDALFYIDTGTAVHEDDERMRVIAHVQSVSAELGKPLYVAKAGDAYERMVLGGTRISRGVNEGRLEAANGFPGPGMHGKAYTRLKERQIEATVADTKRGRHRNDAVLFISGVYRDESKRREKRMHFTEHGSAKYVNPLIDWTRHDMRRYRAENGLPQSDIAALLHRSGECNCGAFAAAGVERTMLQDLCPKTFGRIRDLELRAERRGVRWCRWGGYDLDGIRTTEVSEERTGIACSGCPIQDELFAGVAA